MGFEWQFTPDPKNLEAARLYSWPATPSLPNQIEPGCFKASNYTYLFTSVSGIALNNPDVVDEETIARIARGLRTLYDHVGMLPDDALIEYPATSFLPVDVATLRDLVLLFEFAAQHRLCAIGL